MTTLMSRIHSGVKVQPRRTLLYGVHGIGKSSFAASADKPIFIQTEDGLGDIDCASFPLARSYDDVIQSISELYSEKHDFQTVVIDSLDWLERIIWAHFCKSKNIKNIEDVGYGKGFLYVMDLWKEVFTGLEALRDDRGMHVILLAHSSIERFSSPDVETFDRYAPKLHKFASAMVQEWCDDVLFANYKVHTKQTDEGFGRKKVKGIGQGERVLHTTELPAHNAKNRLGMPDQIPMDFAEYAKFFPNKKAGK